MNFYELSLIMHKNYLFLILSFLPSFIWLLFYLRKDAHPESNSMILKVFFLGMFFAIPTIFIELFFRSLINCQDDFCFCQTDFQSNYYFLLICFLNIFIGVAFVEETIKYLVVKISVLKNSEFDEPLDVMLYMIISALGFVALENILYILFAQSWGEVFTLLVFRFISATFLHALTSGILGYFIAIGFQKSKKRKVFFLIGFFIAVILHGLYNFYIINKEIYPASFIVIGLALLVSFAFKKIKKIPSVCKIN